MNIKKEYSARFSKRNHFLRKLIPHALREPIQKVRGKEKYRAYFDQNNSLFIHIPKTAGQSLAELLFNDRHPGHWKYSDFEWENKNKASDYFSFCIVRNPYDRLVSAFFYLKNSTKSEMDKYFTSKVLSKYETFEEFVVAGLKDQEVLKWVHFIPQVEFIKGSAGGIAVDYVGKMENLSESVDFICRKLKRDYVSLPKVNASKRKDFNVYYTVEMKEIVYDVYREDFESLNYSK